MKVSVGVALLALALAGAATGVARSSGPVEPHPELPEGNCQGSWKAPKVVVPLDRDNLAPRPYERFGLTRLFRKARRHQETFADGYIRANPRLRTVTFIFTEEVKARLRELRSSTRYPANLRGLRACFSIRELGRIQRLVNDGVFTAGPTDPPLVGRVEFTSVNVFRNRVDVALRRFRKVDEEAIEARYGAAVRVLRGDNQIVPRTTRASRVHRTT
jgi:hypothetical protein